MTFIRIVIRSNFLVEHDLFRKPASTFRDHALASSAGNARADGLTEVKPDTDLFMINRHCPAVIAAGMQMYCCESEDTYHDP